MGVVIYRRVTNIFDIPRDILVKCIGRGLIVDSECDQHGGEGPCCLEVDAGQGLGFDQGGALIVDAGAGLGFDPSGALTVVPGGGLKTDSQGNLAVNVGAGLEIAQDGSLAALVSPIPHSGLSVDLATDELNVNVGSGLFVDTDNAIKVNIAPQDGGLFFDDQGRLGVDYACYAGTQMTITLVTDVSLSINGHKLMLQKTYTDFLVKRNCAGLLLDIEEGESRTEEDDVILTDYGYSGSGMSARQSTPTAPNFYQK